MEGNIIVDGVLASCYASASHDLAHIGMTPIRWFPSVVEWILGEHDISSAYVNIAIAIAGWLNFSEIIIWMLFKVHGDQRNIFFKYFQLENYIIFTLV